MENVTFFSQSFLFIYWNVCNVFLAPLVKFINILWSNFLYENASYILALQFFGAKKARVKC
jgi:hypothetical protein